MNAPRTRPLIASLAAIFALAPAARAQDAPLDPQSLVGGASNCPTPALVWQRLVTLIPWQVLVERLHSPGGAGTPAEIVDLGPSFRVIASGRVREYADETRDCAKRAQFAAVFIALVAGADTTPAITSPPPPVVVARHAPAEVLAPPPSARARVDLAAVAGVGLGGAEPAIAPGLSLRIALGRWRLAPVVGVTAVGPLDLTAGGVAIRQWQVTADAGLRSASLALGRARLYAELGAAFELLWDRPTTLLVGRTQVSYAAGPRAAVGLLLATRGRLSPFLMIQAAWFPGAPELFALPAGELGHSASWNLGAAAGASWGLL